MIHNVTAAAALATVATRKATVTGTPLLTTETAEGFITPRSNLAYSPSRDHSAFAIISMPMLHARLRYRYAKGATSLLPRRIKTTFEIRVISGPAGKHEQRGAARSRLAEKETKNNAKKRNTKCKHCGFVYTAPGAQLRDAPR